MFCLLLPTIQKKIPGKEKRSSFETLQKIQRIFNAHWTQALKLVSKKLSQIISKTGSSYREHLLMEPLMQIALHVSAKNFKKRPPENISIYQSKSLEVIRILSSTCVNSFPSRQKGSNVASHVFLIIQRQTHLQTQYLQNFPKTHPEPIEQGKAVFQGRNVVGAEEPAI